MFAVYTFDYDTGIYTGIEYLILRTLIRALAGVI